MRDEGLGILLAVLALAVASCTPAVRLAEPAGPEVAGSEVWDRLGRLSSFQFRLKYHTDIPVRIEYDYAGRWQAPDREEWVGRHAATGLQGGRVTGLQVVTRLRARGNSQYEQTGLQGGRVTGLQDGWRKSARGVETRVFEQARQALQGVALEPAGEKAGCFIYRFAPKATVLDPTQRMQLEGRLEIDARTGLPLVMAYGDATGRAEWRMEFSRFNRAGTVRVPFVPEQVVAAEPAQRLASGEWRVAGRVLRTRMQQLGLEFRLRRAGAGFELQLAEALALPLVELLLSPGRVELWEAEWANADSGVEDLRLVAVGGDAARTARLRQLEAGNERLEARPDLLLPMRPELVVPAGRVGEGTLCVLVIDGLAAAAARASADGSVRFSDLGSATTVAALAAIASGPVLPARFRAESKH